MGLSGVKVLHRTGQWCRGEQRGRVVRYQVPLLPHHRLPGRPDVETCFLLLDEGVQLTRPVTFTGALEGAWYVDLVDLKTVDDGFAVLDRWIDLIVWTTSCRYEILDLDEFADAIADHHLTPTEATRLLRAMQRFIDTHLENHSPDHRVEFRDFPPRSVARW